MFTKAEHQAPTGFRTLFPIFTARTYLASCSQGALSTRVADAMAAFMRSWDEEGNAWDRWVGMMDRLRERFAAFINAEPDEVGITFSASSAINAVAGALDVAARPKLVCSELDFPTVGQILLAQRARGAQVAFAACRDGATPAEAVDAAVDSSTALVAATHVSYQTGARLDADAMAEAAHRRGALFLLDAYQSIGTEPIDVKAIGVDFLVTGALKYLLGPPGVAFVYARRDVAQDLRPLDTGWFAQENPFAFDLEHLIYGPSAARFQSGSPPVPSIYAADAGLELLQEVGTAAIRHHVVALSRRLLEGARASGFDVLTPFEEDERGPMVAFGPVDAGALTARLAGAGLICSPRRHGLRVSFHYYNTEEDVDRLLAELTQHPDLLPARRATR